MTFGDPLTLVFVVLVAGALRLTGGATARAWPPGDGEPPLLRHMEPSLLRRAGRTATVDFAVGRALGRQERPAPAGRSSPPASQSTWGSSSSSSTSTLFARAFPLRTAARTSSSPSGSPSTRSSRIATSSTSTAGTRARARRFPTTSRSSRSSRRCSRDRSRGPRPSSRSSARPRPADDGAASAALFLIASGSSRSASSPTSLASTCRPRVRRAGALLLGRGPRAPSTATRSRSTATSRATATSRSASALLLGIRLKKNFNSPYRASDLAEFWRRWHISLSTWLRDYLFFSLPGKRRGGARAPTEPHDHDGPRRPLARCLVDLRHLGAMHGVGLAIHRFVHSLRPARGAARKVPAWRRRRGTIVTFHFVCVAWVFFRCTTLSQARDVFRALLDGTTGVGNITPAIIAAVAAGLAVQFLPEGWLARFRPGSSSSPLSRRPRRSSSSRSW